MQKAVDFFTACHFIYLQMSFAFARFFFFFRKCKKFSLFYYHVLDSNVKPSSSSQSFKYILPTLVISTGMLNVAWIKTKNHKVSVCAQKHMLVTVSNVSKIFDRYLQECMRGCFISTIRCVCKEVKPYIRLLVCWSEPQGSRVGVKEEEEKKLRKERAQGCTCGHRAK